MCLPTIITQCVVNVNAHSLMGMCGVTFSPEVYNWGYFCPRGLGVFLFDMLELRITSLIRQLLHKTTTFYNLSDHP